MTAEIALAAFINNALESAEGPLVLGLCGAEGSGKSTVAAALAHRFPGTAILSLDDLYLPLDERRRLAREVHPCPGRTTFHSALRR